MKKINKLVCLLFLSLILAGCGTSNADMVETPANMTMQRGRNYREVIEDFQDKGFTNIKIKKIEDLQYGFVVRYEQVETISVGGDTNYDSGVRVPADTEVVISYHAYKTGSGEEAQEVKTKEEQKPAGNTETEKQTEIKAEDQKDKPGTGPAVDTGTDKQEEKPEEKQNQNPDEKPAEEPAAGRENDQQTEPARDLNDKEEGASMPAVSEEAQ